MVLAIVLGTMQSKPLSIETLLFIANTFENLPRADVSWLFFSVTKKEGKEKRGKEAFPFTYLRRKQWQIQARLQRP